ncbi:hypothetical protein C8R45DRAFT_944413 [Mycena sanguinolenta]|nr:hypothetical protein C8R45DRAFT_944413 [Mycena sanguinolenta]
MVGERRRKSHTVTRDSTIPKEVVSLLLKDVLLLLKADKNVSTFVRFHEVCRMFCRVSDLQVVQRRKWRDCAVGVVEAYKEVGERLRRQMRRVDRISASGATHAAPSANSLRQRPPCTDDDAAGRDNFPRTIHLRLSIQCDSDTTTAHPQFFEFCLRKKEQTILELGKDREGSSRTTRSVIQDCAGVPSPPPPPCTRTTLPHMSANITTHTTCATSRSTTSSPRTAVAARKTSPPARAPPFPLASELKLRLKYYFKSIGLEYCEFDLNYVDLNPNQNSDDGWIWKLFVLGPPEFAAHYFTNFNLLFPGESNILREVAKFWLRAPGQACMP